MTIIYRLELIDTPSNCSNVNKGVHQDFDILDGRCTVGSYLTENGIWRHDHPTPHNDMGLKHHWERLHPEDKCLHVFGFKSLFQLKEWFCIDFKRVGEIEKLKILRIGVYKTDQFHHGDHQSIFHCHHCELIETIPFTKELMKPDHITEQNFELEFA